MNEITQLIATIKRQLKAQGVTYRAVAEQLNLSEAAVKRLFASERMSLERLAQLCQILGFTMAEMMQQADENATQIALLTEAQERQLVRDEQLLLIAVCLVNHWSVADIVVTYRFSEAQIFSKLSLLDKIGLIELLPANRVRLKVKRDFEWIKNGPIRQFFLHLGMPDFLAGHFNEANAAFEFAHGMLTDDALQQFQLELRRLKQKLATLHDECSTAPLAKKHGTGLLIAMREWEFEGFRQLRR